MLQIIRRGSFDSGQTVMIGLHT